MSNPTAPSAGNNIRKYVLVDTPVFPKGKEGATFLFNRNQVKSVSSAIKEFFLKIPMRAEGKKQIAEIFSSYQFKDNPKAQDILKDMKKLRFWEGVDARKVGDVLAQAALQGIHAFTETDGTLNDTDRRNTLRKSLVEVLPDLEEVYLSEPANLKEVIKIRLKQQLKSDKDDSTFFYSGLEEFISHLENREKEVSFLGNAKIQRFMGQVKKMEDRDPNFPRVLTDCITQHHESYVDKFETAKKNRTIVELGMKENQKLTAKQENQIQIAVKMAQTLAENSAFKGNEQALNAFIEFFAFPYSGFNLEKLTDYVQFLNQFYENIELLSKPDQTECLHVADRLEGYIQKKDGIGFEVFDAKNHVKDKDTTQLMESLKKHPEPSSSLLSFLFYLKLGAGTINAQSYWKLLQFAVNQKTDVAAQLNEKGKTVFKAALLKLTDDLRNYAKNNNKIMPEKAMVAASANSTETLQWVQVIQLYKTGGFKAVATNVKQIKLLEMITQSETKFIQLATGYDNNLKELFRNIQNDLKTHQDETFTTIDLS
jgi:hypothetical protein